MSETSVIDKLNAVLSSMHVLNVKLHNYHWNVSGMQFHAIHTMTEAYYYWLFAQFDDVAERILQLKAKPISTTSGYLELSAIGEDEGTHFDATYVLKNVIADFGILLGQIKDANAAAEEASDLGTLDMLSGQVAWIEKQIWLMESTLGK